MLEQCCRNGGETVPTRLLESRDTALPQREIGANDKSCRTGGAKFGLAP